MHLWFLRRETGRRGAMTSHRLQPTTHSFHSKCCRAYFKTCRLQWHSFGCSTWLSARHTHMHAYTSDNNHMIDYVLLLLLLVWQAPLGVRSAKRRHQSPEWTILSHSYRLIQGEIVRPQVLLDSLHPRSSRTSWWSPPDLRRGSSYDTPGTYRCTLIDEITRQWQ